VNFELVRAEEATYPTALMCRGLGVSRSGYLDWRSRTPSPRDLDDARLDLEVSWLFVEKRRRYGSPRLHAELRLRGRRSSRKRIAASMLRQRLAARRPRKLVATTDSKHSEVIAPNLVQRTFTVEAPDRVWVADTTYLPTLVGFVYLVAVIDLYSRKVVGWCVGDTLDSALAAEALRRAIASRRPSQGLVFHTDRGAEFAAARVRELLKGIGARQSMSRKGDCWDNAVAESFFSTLEFEGPALTASRTPADDEPALFRFIDGYYNFDRLHSFNGYRSPDEAETTWRRMDHDPAEGWIRWGGGAEDATPAEAARGMALLTKLVR